VQLLIFPGFFSPGWALDGVKTDQFPLQYGPGKGKVETLPMPWDQVYLDRWFAFLKELSDKYGNSAAFRLVGADGPTSVSAEATLPNSGADLKKWKSDGYTPSKYIDAWKSVFRTYAADFPNQFISLSLGSGLAINDKGRIDAGQNSITKQDIVDLANAILRRRFTLQYSNLDGFSHPDVQGGMAFVAGYNGRVVTGFQMRASANGKAMGDDGDPPLSS
jgi:hypothetical protein